MSNQVTLVFAGDASKLQTTSDVVGKDLDDLAERSHLASERMAEGFDYASSQSSLLSGGIGDVGGALTEAFGENTAVGQFGAKMEQASAIVTGFTGVMDLGIFATNNLKLATAAHAIQQGIASTGTKVWAAAQWVMNSALFASPITWVVAGIVALIAVIVLIATKTDWFSRAWRASWGWIKSAASNTWDFLKKIPGWLQSAFSRVGSFIVSPYRAAFNGIARAWNNTIGRLSWSVPSWVPFIGGNSISVPNLPTFHSGGVVPGVVGTPTVALLQAGEKVSSVAGGGGGGELVIRGDGSQLGDALVDVLAAAVRRRGGNGDQLGIRIVSKARTVG